MRVKATKSDVEDGTNGGCIGCGAIQYGGCEPDAREYECEECGKPKVYGLEELVIMGLVDLSDDDEPDTE